MTRLGYGLAISTGCALLAAGVLAQPACVPDNGSIQDDGNYRWFFHSWVAPSDRAFSFSRCVAPIDPPSMHATWEGVVPGGIARAERPLWSSVPYPTGETASAASRLFFGNADDVLENAPYVAHPIEAGRTGAFPTAAVTEDDLGRLTAAGPLTLASQAQLSVAIEGNPDVADVDFWFASAVDPSGLIEHAVFVTVKTDADLSVGFADPRLSQTFVESHGTDVFDVLRATPDQQEVQAMQSGHYSTQAKGGGMVAGYARGDALLMDARRAVLARIPITYFVEE